MKYKVIATDFDGTLLNSEGKITEKTYEGLKEYHKKGHIIVGVTGRILSSIINKIDIGLFDYLILCDGTFIYDVKNKKTIFASFIPHDIIENITINMLEKVKEINYASLTNYYILKQHPINNFSHLKPINTIKEIVEPISRMTLFFKNNEEAEYHQKIIHEKYPLVNSFIMEDSFDEEKRININLKNINKKTTLEYLAKQLKIDTNEIIFFGDGLNDLEIFSSNIFSVAMSNALKEIKEKSNDITLTNDQDGVITYLEKIKN